jgi:5-methyltetrahydrofolate--homocysteine methyltransferase
MNVLEEIKKRVLILDGAMGTEIMKRTGSSDIGCPELMNIEKTGMITDIHKSFIEAGADIIETNSFGGNRIKLRDYNLADRVEELNLRAVEVAREAIRQTGKQVFIAGSIGPIGKLIKPLGELSEDDVYDNYYEQVKALSKGGVDFILIETQIDILEAKIGLRAAKDASNLPVVISISYPIEGGLTLTGTTPEIAAATFNSTDADIFGINCGGHPKEFIDFVRQIKRYSDKPLIVYANAGIPEKKGGKISYPMKPDEYLGYVENFYENGVNIVGGCCGTNPEHIRVIANKYKGKKPVNKSRYNKNTIITSRNRMFEAGSELCFKIIGENINPFGKKKLLKELKEENLDMVRKLARKQEEAGADALDINFGRTGDKKPEFYSLAIKRIQGISQIPLLIDNNKIGSIEAAMKVYSGKPFINSITGDAESYEKLFPLARKYGGGAILLALNEKGIPENGEDRVKIIEKLYKKAKDYGFKDEDILIDPIVLTISTSQKNGEETIKAIRMIKEMGLNTVIGLSNFSFGLPGRALLNRVFLANAIFNGLDSAILNPLDKEMIDTIKASDGISGRDKGLSNFVEIFRNIEVEIEDKTESKNRVLSDKEKLYNAIIEGEKEIAKTLTLKLIEEGNEPLKVLEDILSPALKKVGDFYERKIYFLPQLILSAEAMEEASSVLEEKLKIEEQAEKKVKIVIATVKGDLHDIGKNIVALVLRNYGYDVIDMGKNTPADIIVETAIKKEADIIALSALMTTTMEEMDKIVGIKNRMAPDKKVIIGGAAVSPSFAREIGADAYGKDAMDTIKKIEKLFA